LIFERTAKRRGLRQLLAVQHLQDRDDRVGQSSSLRIGQQPRQRVRSHRGYCVLSRQDLHRRLLQVSPRQTLTFHSSPHHLVHARSFLLVRAACSFVLAYALPCLLLRRAQTRMNAGGRSLPMESSNDEHEPVFSPFVRRVSLRLSTHELALAHDVGRRRRSRGRREFRCPLRPTAWSGNTASFARRCRTSTGTGAYRSRASAWRTRVFRGGDT
jgi:hypothetical protein